MRTPKEFATGDGPRWRVRYRRDGKQTTQTFEVLAEAEKFCIDLDAYGAHHAEQLLYDRLADVAAITPALDDWVRTYLEDICDANPTTRAKYQRNYELHISPLLGTLPIGRITDDDCRRVVRNLGETKGLRDATVGNVFTPLSGALAAAHRRGLIATNPAAETKIPTRTSHLDDDDVFLTRVEYLHLRSAIDPRFLGLVDFAVGTGMRWGELAALQLRDLDLQACTVRINKAVKQDGKVGPPKTKRSIRTITFPRELLATLLPLLEDKAPNDLVFTMPRGGRLHSRSFSTRYWIPAVTKAGLVDPRPTPHGLRHSHASWLLQDGVDIVQVSRRLGHASIQVTVDTYGHLDPNATERQAQIAGQVFAGVLPSAARQ